MKGDSSLISLFKDGKVDFFQDHQVGVGNTAVRFYRREKMLSSPLYTAWASENL